MEDLMAEAARLADAASTPEGQAAYVRALRLLDLEALHELNLRRLAASPRAGPAVAGREPVPQRRESR